MAKGWTQIYSNASQEKMDPRATVKAHQKWDKLIRNTKSLSVAELRKQSNELYAKKRAKEESFIAAVESGKLTGEDNMKLAEEYKKQHIAEDKKEAAYQKKLAAKKAKEEAAKKAAETASSEPAAQEDTEN